MCPCNRLIFSCIFVQVSSGFLHEDDMRIVIRQIRDRVMQVKRERERRVEMGSQQSINSANDSNSSTVQPQGTNTPAAQQQVKPLLHHSESRMLTLVFNLIGMSVNGAYYF